MQRTTFQQLVIAGLACAVALFASDFWKTKDYTQWTSEEVNKVLTDSPWAKQMTVNAGQTGMGQRRGSGGGSGRGGSMGGSGRGGIGFPGGGIGFPGGGYPGGGGGGGGRDPDDGQRGGMRSMNVVLRWESALPVQHALLRERGRDADEQRAAEDAGQKNYVIAVMGLQLPGRRSGADPDDIDQDRSNQSNDDVRSMLLDAAQLVPKGRAPIAAEDVQLEGRNGSSAIRFLFPKTISADEHEVVFHFETRGLKVEHKFHLGDMSYQGKLAL